MRANGIVTALLTPLNKDYTLCRECLRDLIEFQANNGVNGLYLTGTYGEGVVLPLKTRIEVLEKAIEYAPSNLYLLPHIGAASLDVVYELARAARDLGYKDLSVVGPIYHKPTRVGLVRYYEEIASRTELHIIIYNNKGRQGYNISPDDFQAIIENVTSVVGIKDTSNDVVQLLEYVKRFGHKYYIAAGGDNLIFHTFVMGAHAHICGVSNTIPEVAVGIYNAVKSGDLGKALDLQYKIDVFKKRIGKVGVETQEVLRQMLKMRGLNPGHPPAQLSFDFDEKTLKELREALEAVLPPLKVGGRA